MSSSVMTGGCCRRRHERITVDELRLDGVGDDDWIKSNQINCGKWMVAWHGMLVIYDCVGTYEETKIMDCHVSQ